MEYGELTNQTRARFSRYKFSFLATAHENCHFYQKNQQWEWKLPDLIQLMAIHSHTAHMHEFHEYEFHIPRICSEYEFESYEYAMNMNLKAMNMP